jgi:hypothetical protein
MSSAEGHRTKRGWHRAGPRRLDGQSQTTRPLAATGLRRVDWVRLVVDHDQVRAEAVGVGYRLPTTRPIPLWVAEALMAEGTPSVTRTVGHGPADQTVRHEPARGLDAGR